MGGKADKYEQTEREYEMPYIERNVMKSSGERFATTDIEIFVV